MPRKEFINDETFSEMMGGFDALEEHINGRVQLPSRVIEVAPVTVYRGAEVREIRETSSLTQSIFAEALGVSRKTVEAWESGRNTPTGPAQRILSSIKEDPAYLSREHILNEA
ncbi:MAG: helix-turn-helix domain-containing protein [Spirochaetaceae bacterium]|nr:helix-turn-helix domain-containing protein [Spirochaetaceae bacterium]